MLLLLLLTIAHTTHSLTTLTLAPLPVLWHCPPPPAPSSCSSACYPPRPLPYPLPRQQQRRRLLLTETDERHPDAIHACIQAFEQQALAQPKVQHRSAVVAELGVLHDVQRPASISIGHVMVCNKQAHAYTHASATPNSEHTTL